MSDALRGENEGDLAGFIAETRTVFAKLDRSGDDLGQLITNFNGFAGALANESENLSRTIADLEPTLREADHVVRGAQRCPAAAAGTCDRVGARDRGAARNDRRLQPMARPDRSARSGGRARRPRTPTAQDRAGPRRGQSGGDAAVRADDRALAVLEPGPDPDRATRRSRRMPTGPPARRTGTSSSTGSSISRASARASMATARTCACRPAAGRSWSTTPTRPADRATRSTSPTRSRRPQGNQPVQPASPPPFRMDFPCANNDPPNLNGPAAAAGPADLVP